MKAVLAALVVIALVACGREESARAPASDAGKDAAKSDTRKGNNSETAPGGKDPMKEGY